MIIITGVSKGIGEFLLQQYIEKGEEVFGIYNSTPVQKELKSYCRKVDIQKPSEIEEFIFSLDNISKLVLINCAGISYNSYAHKADLNRWKQVIDVNLVGTFNMIHFLLPIMRKQCYGRIINFSSVVAQVPTPGVSAYAASKAALIGLTRSLSIENASKGITVNSINLGYANIGMGVNDVPQTFKEEVIKKIPKCRFCYPNEIYETIEYLIATDYITGTAIDLNGGLY